MKINKNPLTIRGLLKRCWLFSYRVPIETVGALVPLSLVTHRESAEWPALLGAGAKLELCFEVDPIEYQWNRGETWEVAA
ncbi:MAG: hypothetical protein JWL90_4720 [Chthoniobacteraceae bacterium]|nr:hypothetical protein [Chthoniobacteraceae bacterium]MDB6173648.1 hypothetical protein [Chthoniobacteraceae bacterium]